MDNKEWFAAARNGKIQTLQKIIQNEQFGEIDMQDEEGRTALMIAAANGHDQCVRLLLQSNALGSTVLPKASIDIQNKWGWTALIFATNYTHYQCVKLLLQSGATTDIQDEWGWTALKLAALRGCHQSVQLLLEAGADSFNLTTSYTEFQQEPNTISDVVNSFESQLVNQVSQFVIPDLAKCIVQFIPKIRFERILFSDSGSYSDSD